MKRLMNKLGGTSWTDFRELFMQFLKFGLVGVSNTAVNMAIYYFVLWINDDWYLVGNILGNGISIINAFVWNDLFVFTGNPRDFKSILKRLGRTYVSYSGTAVLSYVLLWVEVTAFGVSKVLAPVLNMVVTIPLNFLINKFWSFANTGK